MNSAGSVRRRSIPPCARRLQTHTHLLLLLRPQRVHGELVVLVLGPRVDESRAGCADTVLARARRVVEHLKQQEKREKDGPDARPTKRQRKRTGGGEWSEKKRTKTEKAIYRREETEQQRVGNTIEIGGRWRINGGLEKPPWRVERPGTRAMNYLPSDQQWLRAHPRLRGNNSLSP